MSNLRNRRASANDPGDELFDELESIDILSIFGMLKRRKWMIGAVTLVGAVLGGLYGKSLIPTYTASAAVLIEPAEQRVVDLEAVMNGLTTDQATIATQIRLLQSRTYQARVMEDLGLFEDPEFNHSLAEPSAKDEFIDNTTDMVVGILPEGWAMELGLIEEPRLLTPLDEQIIRQNAISRFAKGYQLTADGISHLITISFTSDVPAKAAKIANRTAEMYVDDQLKNKLFATDRASVWLEERLGDLREEVRLADQTLADFRSSNNIYAEDGPTLNQQELSDLNRELIIARADLAETQARISLVRRLRSQGQSLDSITEVVNSPLIVRLREQEADLLRQEVELANLYGERHPQMVDLRNEIARLATKIASEVDRIVRTLNNDLQIGTTRMQTIESQLVSLKSVNADDQAADVRMKELERQALASRGLYETFLQRFKETREQVQIVQPDVRIIASASTPSVPSSPGPNLFAAGGFAASFVIACLIAIVLERLDRGIRSAKQVEARLGLITMGLVPKLAKLKRKQKPYEYLMEKPLSAYAEAIRSVFMSIKLSKVDHEPKVILVTSSVPEEGKTTFSVSLGAMIAASHKRVLLIDLDLRHPSVHRELGWQVSGGLVEFMANERTLDEAIHHDLETGLHFLPIKGQTTNPTELIDSQKMRELLDTCRENYDFIVLDTAPVASVTDTRIAARVADSVVFVVRWGATVASAAEDSVQALRDVGVEPAGVVLSQVDFKKHAQYGYADVGEYYSQSQKYYVN